VATRIASDFETMRVKFAPRLGFLRTVSCFSNPYAGTSSSIERSEGVAERMPPYEEPGPTT
jgi:hypothetical protein